MTNSANRKPGVAQTLSLIFENDPTLADLYWMVDRAREAGLPRESQVFLDYDDQDSLSPTGLSIIMHPDVDAE